MTNDGVIMLREVGRVLGAAHLDHVLDEIPIPALETGQRENHVLAGWFKAEENKV